MTDDTLTAEDCALATSLLTMHADAWRWLAEHTNLDANALHKKYARNADVLERVAANLRPVS